MFPVLLSVEPCPTVKPTDEKSVVCRAWVKGGVLYVLACSLRNESMDAEVEVMSGSWRFAGAEIGTPVTLSTDRRLKFAFEPYAVSFVRLKPAQ